MRGILAGIGIATLLAVGAVASPYNYDDNYHKYHRSYDDMKGRDFGRHQVRGDDEDPCDKLYDCLDHCPTVANKKCIEKCKAKYPDCDEI